MSVVIKAKRTLKYVKFEETRMRDSALARLACELPDLETLNLTYCSRITEQGIASFLNKATKGKLKRLEIRSCYFLTDADPDYIQKVEEDYPQLDISILL